VANNLPLFFHTPGTSSDLTTNSAHLLPTGANTLVKADGGTLNQTGKSYFTGATIVNDGKLVLSSGNNTLLVIPTATVATTADLVVNSGAVGSQRQQSGRPPSHSDHW